MFPSAVEVVYSGRVCHVIVGHLVEVGHLVLVLLLLDEVVVLLHHKAIVDGKLLKLSVDPGHPFRVKPCVLFLDVHIVLYLLLGVLVIAGSSCAASPFSSSYESIT